MVHVVSAGRRLERVAADAPAAALELLQEGLELASGAVVVDRRPDGGDPGSARVVEAGAGADAAGRDLDVPTGGRADADERALRGLVRRLVLGEAHVAERAEDLGLAELRGQRRTQRDHRTTHGVVVGALVLVPERAGVVDLEVVVEVERLGW